jgi:hypothetical protein
LLYIAYISHIKNLNLLHKVGSHILYAASNEK